jgi:hypothetical protein
MAVRARTARGRRRWRLTLAAQAEGDADKHTEQTDEPERKVGPAQRRSRGC